MAILDCTHSYTNNKRNPNHMGIESVLEVQRVWRKKVRLGVRVLYT